MKAMKIMFTIIFTCGLAAPHRTMGEPVAPRAVQRTYIRPSLESQSLSQRLEAAQQVSNRCATPSGSCVLDQSAPVGTPCWCATPNGPVSGVVR